MLTASSLGDPIRRDAAPSSGYGLAEFGADWDAAEGVLLLIHGRDREADELPILAAGLPPARGRKLLAPHALSKSWYAGRYDAPYAGNAPALAAGLLQVRGAFDLALARGFGPERVVLAGFSQGACLVAEYLLSAHPLPGAAALFTGSVPDIANRRAGRALDGLPIVVTGGSSDPWLPIRDLMATGSFFEAAGAEVHLEVFPDAGHVVRPAEIGLLGELLDRSAA